MKKIVFLLVLVFVMFLTTVTAMAAGTDSATPETGFTEDKADEAEAEPEINVAELELKYGDIFFGEATSAKKIVSFARDEKTGEIGVHIYPHHLRFLFEVFALEVDYKNPVIMLMYIKVDGKYVPLVDVKRGTNLTQETYFLKTTVDLKYLSSSSKVNEIRIIAFKKNDIDNLVLDENLEITDMIKSVRAWDTFDKPSNPFKAY